jgi:hypothetical protein
MQSVRHTAPSHKAQQNQGLSPVLHLKIILIQIVLETFGRLIIAKPNEKRRYEVTGDPAA